MNIEEFYQQFDEDNRLCHSYASSIEYITTMHFIHKFIEKGANILELGAATGAYTIQLAKDTYIMSAVEPVEKHLNLLREKAKELPIQIHAGSAVHLDEFENESFDAVLCMGPLYHLYSEKERKQCIKEAIRVCKKGGVLFFAYVPNDMVFITESMYTKDFLIRQEYDPVTFKLFDDTIILLDEQQFPTLMKAWKIKEITHFSADGVAELMAERINSFTEEEFDIWMKFHLYTCEKKTFLGYGNHLVYIGRK